MRKAGNGRMTGDPLDALRHDIAAIRNDLTAVLNAGVEAAGERAGAALGQAGQTVRDVADTAAERIGEYHKRLGDAAGANPLATIGIAAALGAMTALLVERMLRE